MRTSPDAEERSVRCTASGCSCVCFKPGSVQLRSCDRCGHGWVPHALAKLQFQAQPPSSCGPVEVALPGLVFDLSSLVLYGAQAVPVRLKILLDRLYSILSPEQVGHILHTLGWSLGDYVRGYMLQHPSGKVLDRWLTATPEEELLILKQFLRFGETRPIVELMTLQCLGRLSDPELISAPKGFRSNASGNGGTPGVFRNTRGESRFVASVCRIKRNSPADGGDAVHHFENIPGGASLLLPFHFPSSAVHGLVPPTKELVPPSKLTQCLRRLSGTKLGENHHQEGGRREQENDPGLKIKADPDQPNPARSVWHQDLRFHGDQELELHRSTSSLSPSLNSSFIPSSSSSLHPSISSPPPKTSQRLQSSSSYSLNPLPSFSSSFLCPLPTPSFSSSLLRPLPSSSSSLLRPLPSSLCSLTSLSPAGGRKGRVCCGVCGKSFYDKGTLKIHYNAVHLKIKHRCTVAGCTMVFSSLRSRNRHSANPNPRLHTGATHRNASVDSDAMIHKDNNAHEDVHTRMCEEKDVSDTLWEEDDDAHMLVHEHALRNGLNAHTNRQHGCRDDTPPPSNSPPPPPPPPLPPLPPLPRTRQDTNQIFTLSDGSDLHTQQAPPPLPPLPPPLLPARGASSLGSPQSLVPLVLPAPEETERHRRLLTLHANRPAPAPLPDPDPVTTASCTSRPVSRDYDVTEGKREEDRTSRWESGHPAPKKKPRKSSMPVKIERETVEGGRDEEEEEEC
ncbi:zinc finger protein basonuclin-2-like [Sebastes umbrosus]|uniref:zinc finger protein basonuclin-2-like n=1 Tax=Sebastes umbrosus TaxID=72105 RepID=UPI00189DD476|nr:zinc finger protein basonuclin-2-like [Sebastes umbrosus]